MAKGKKKLRGKQKRGKQKRPKGKKGGKGKKKIPLPKTELEIRLTEQMLRRARKKMRPMKVLQDKYKRIMEHYDRKGSGRPVYSAGHFVMKGSKEPTSSPQGAIRSTKETSLGELEEVFLVRRTTMLEKRKGEVDDSPINIDTATAKKCNYLRLTFEGLFDPERKTVIRNSGYHVIGNLGGEVLISSGPLFGKYKLDNFHLHYGESCYDGTEHTINGRRFTLEIHIVFLPHSDNVDITMESFTMTAKKVVVGLMFKLSHTTFHYELFSVVPHINQKGKILETSNNLLYDFKDVLSGSEYYNYSGSGTEGDHKEYEWLLFKKVLPINRNQMQNLWDLRKSDAVKSNVKPLQQVGERTIFTPFYYDHQKCRGKETCECLGRFKPFKSNTKLKIPNIE